MFSFRVSCPGGQFSTAQGTARRSQDIVKQQRLELSHTVNSVCRSSLIMPNCKRPCKQLQSPPISQPRRRTHELLICTQSTEIRYGVVFIYTSLMMLGSPRYEAVPRKPVPSNGQIKTEPNFSDTVREVNNNDKSFAPQRLDASWGTRILRAFWDLIFAAIALLFTIFGFLVYRNDGKPPVPGSQAAAVVSVAKYGPTMFSILFAAIAGGAMKAIATWRIQKGSTIGFIEQLLGSNTISGALITQVQLRAFNILGLILVVLWCLSPLGSQASLRVVSVRRSFPSDVTSLKALDTFAGYELGSAEGESEALTTVRAPFTAAMMSASLLKNRNQDLWGNIRIPAIERLVVFDESTTWLDIPDPTSVEYHSLVGAPLTGLESTGTGSTTFTLSGSYLNVTCGVLEPQATSTNFTASNVTKPGGNTDCTWGLGSASGVHLQIAMSEPCAEVNVTDLRINNGTRDARKLIWESFNIDGTENNQYTRAECELHTTYVDVNMTCVGSTCSPASVRRSPRPPRDGNWTVFDFGNGWLDQRGFLSLWSEFFPNVVVSAGLVPMISYIVDPYNAITSQNTTNTYLVGRTVFEMGLAQMLNAQLVIGISPSDITGGFNPARTNTTLFGDRIMDISATTLVEQDIVHCDRNWLGVLVFTSLTLFLVAVAAAILRLTTLVPDILGTLSLGMLDNQCRNLAGNSTWSGNERAVKMRKAKVRLGDVRPDSKVGQIALAFPSESAAMVQRRRIYR
ncbi:uncharacterized protein PAC_08049 [Phialocephala subalpina]|uniref:Uncharacterized protein n=1 Tax=Phialocephala subalpina TaxID=576137 RepID=A0A1L7WZG5_9HELO|nr:uncharacterized protein PAC_08049 [Phialocephala subalpina]